MRAFNQAVAVAAMCLHEEPAVRPLISDVVTALTFLGTNSESDQPSSCTDSLHIPSSPPEEPPTKAANLKLLDNDSVAERQRAVAEAIKWGSASRNNAVSQRPTVSANASS